MDKPRSGVEIEQIGRRFVDAIGGLPEPLSMTTIAQEVGRVRGSTVLLRPVEHRTLGVTAWWYRFRHKGKWVEFFEYDPIVEPWHQFAAFAHELGHGELNHTPTLVTVTADPTVQKQFGVNGPQTRQVMCRGELSVAEDPQEAEAEYFSTWLVSEVYGWNQEGPTFDPDADLARMRAVLGSDAENTLSRLGALLGPR